MIVSNSNTNMVSRYYAYEIDELNEPDKRIMGFKCKSWNDFEKKCSRPYEACKSKNKKDETPRSRCNYSELLFSLGKAPTDSDWVGPGGVFDVEDTAKRCYARYTNPENTGKPTNNVPNFAPYSAMKGEVHDFNDFIKKMGEYVVKTYRDLPTDKRNA